jgi:asparagine synthase (glutamine-hydrolysing)
MCGICGIIEQDNEHQRIVDVLKMNEKIFHRGPNEAGIYSDENCTLAMRRLSIIDLQSGKQPIYSSNKKFLILFNGEIYNFKKLRSDLISKGFSFSTNSDTEVVVNLYCEYKISMLSMLEGMFAFCIYDLQERRYFFGRDRFGEKPLFYYKDQSQMMFSSEIASLLCTSRFRPKLKKSLIADYLRRGFIPEPNTLLENVFSLPPGHYMEINADLDITVNSFIETKYSPDSSIKTINDAVNLIKPIFEQSVEKQLTSDVPIGAFLSGGIDSSSVVAVMAKYSDKPIKTFTAKFQVHSYDESFIAKSVAHKFNTEHHEITIDNYQFKQDLFWKIIEHIGFPFPDSSAIPTYLLTKEISKHVKVAISGDGGDEVFGGYTVFDWIYKVSKSKIVPQLFKKAITPTLSFLNKNIFDSNKIRQLLKGLEISDLKISEIIQETQSLFSEKELKSLIINEFDFLQFDDFNECNTILRNSMLYRLKYDLPLDMLVKVDRMSMANSLEVRSPFLDPILFEASCKLPDKFLRNNGLGKLVIREMMKDELPELVFNHPKSGFSIPLHKFKNDEFIDLANSLLNQPYMISLFQEKELARIKKLGLEYEKNSSSGSIYRITHQLWSLMMLSGWIKHFSVEIK